MVDTGVLIAGIQTKKREFNLESVCFDQQERFIKDPSRLKALFCTRRAAKSYTGGIYLVSECLEKPNINCLFIGLTRLSAQGIIWKDILKDLNQRFSLQIRFNETVLTATFPNGSVIYVAGADDNESEMNKLLGKKYGLVILDEASMYSINMHQLVYGVLKPATADQRGTICLLGTSSNITRGLFYDITTVKEAGWSVHQWTAYDNPHVRVQWKEEIEDIEKNRPLFKETALYKQWYLNQWVVDEEALVYRFNDDRNSCDAKPYSDVPYSYILGIDLGHSPDPSAFVVGAYNLADPNLYVVHAEKHLEMDVTAVAEKIKELDKRFKFDVKVIDGSNKMAVAELNSRHQVSVVAADKLGKENFINILNSELIQGKIKLLPETKELKEELRTLVWVTDNGVVKIPRKEHPNLPNHLSDAFLYMWRYCYQYLYERPIEPRVINWNKQEEWEPKHIQKLTDQVKKQQNPHHLDLPDSAGLFEDYEI